MRSRFKLLIGLLGASLALGLPWALLSPGEPMPASGPIAAAGANPLALEASFRTWSVEHELRGGDRDVFFSLGWSKGYSREETTARGIVRLDLLDGAAQVEVRGLAAGEEWDVWLVDNQPGGGALPDRGDRRQRLGRLKAGGGTARLSSRLGAGFFDRFEADLVVVTRAGERPGDAGGVFGNPHLFQRLYPEGRMKPSWVPGHVATGVASLFGPGIAAATAFDSLDPLVARGAEVFQNETFGGNGRTCASCHPARNNFTIDPKFIATLPGNDPLFAAENIPALSRNFENPVLLRELGLVLEN